VRQGAFYPGAFKKGLRSERALTLSRVEILVQGFSTSCTAAITEKLCGTAVNNIQVSLAAEKIGAILERLSQGTNRRTRVVRVFPNPEAFLRFISAILMEISGEWETGRNCFYVGSH